MTFKVLELLKVERPELRDMLMDAQIRLNELDSYVNKLEESEQIHGSSLEMVRNYSLLIRDILGNMNGFMVKKEEQYDKLTEQQQDNYTKILGYLEQLTGYFQKQEETLELEQSVLKQLQAKLK